MPEVRASCISSDVNEAARKKWEVKLFENREVSAGMKVKKIRFLRLIIKLFEELLKKQVEIQY